MKLLVLLPLLALLAACDTTRALAPEGAVRAGGFALATDRPAYAPGDVVTLTLRNDGEATGEMGVLTCATLERRTGGGWTDALAFNDRACILMVVYVAPGEEASGELPLDGVAAGTYRFTHRVSGSTVATASFEVR